MPKILVLYHSTYGNIKRMAEAVAEGARQVDGHARRLARRVAPGQDRVAQVDGSAQRASGGEGGANVGGQGAGHGGVWVKRQALHFAADGRNNVAKAAPSSPATT